jgi:serine/threonine protein phosphatase 1
MAKSFQILDLSHARNIFAVGDIHGYFSLMMEKLESLGFDPDLDHLISVGDLVDRGPESERAVEFCAKPWFHWVRGNHEELVHIAASGAQTFHSRNGGSWFETFDKEAKLRFSETVNDAPVILEVLAPSGKRYGFVHACYPADDWNDAKEIAEDHAQLCLWDRDDFSAPKANGIKNIDFVFHGHTPISEPRTVSNVAWIDTGVFKQTGRLTVVKLP